jgi:hypothetical protein
MSTFWKLIRPQFWIFGRKNQILKRLFVLTIILALGLSIIWIFSHLLQDKLSFFSDEQGLIVIAAYLPFVLIFFLAFALLGIGDVLHQLYLTSELELMLIAPVPSRAIFLLKLFQCSRASFVPALGFGALLILSGSIRNAPPAYYVLILLLMLTAIAMTTALIMILVILIARWIPVQKTQTWMPVIIALVTFVLMIFQQPLTQWFLGQRDIIAFFADALLDPVQLSLVVVGFVGLTLAITEIAYRIFDTAFHEGWNRFQEVPTRKTITPPADHYPKGRFRGYQWIPAHLRSFLIKEWLELRRDPQSLIALAQPLVLMVAVVLVPALGKGSLDKILLPLFFWLMLMLLSIYLGILPVGLFQMAIAREGNKIPLLRSIPISMSDMLWGKFWAIWIPTTLSWSLVLLISGVLLQFPFWQVGILLGITIYGLAGASLATVATGGWSIRFNIEDLKRRISTPVSYMLMAVNLIFMLSITSACIWFMIRLFPDRQLISAIRSLSNFSLIGWIFSDKWWIPLILLCIQAIFWIGIKILWDAAIRRLENWESL